MEGLEDPDEPGDSLLRATSDDPEGGLLFLNRGYIAVDPTRRYTIRCTSREPQGEPKTYLAIYQYGSLSPVLPIAIYNIELPGTSTAWQKREFTLGPMATEGVDYAFSPDTRYVKIGLLTCYFSTGQVEVDNIEIAPQ